MKDDFATELRRKNRAKKTIDVYLVHIGYFADYPLSEALPIEAPDITRDHIGGYIETLLSRTNRRTGEPCRRNTRAASTGVSSSSSST